MARSLIASLVLTGALEAGAQGIIDGQCVDQHGALYPGLTVTLERLTWSNPAAFASREFVASTVADEQGRFRFEDVADGAHCLISYHDDTHHTGWHALAFPGQGPYEVGVTRGFQGARGHIVHADGRPAPGVLLERTHIQDFPGHGRLRTVWASAETGPTGEFFLAPLNSEFPQALIVTPPGGEPVPWQIDAREIALTSPDDNRLTLPAPRPGRHVTLRFTDAGGRGLPEAEVTLRPLRPDLQGQPPPEQLTDASGEVHFQGLGDGLWMVRAQWGEYRADSDHFELSESQTGPFTFALLGRGRIRGRVEWTTGQPASVFQVVAHRSHRPPASSDGQMETRAWTRTGPDGSFTLENLVWGDYRVIARRVEVVDSRRSRLSAEVTLGEATPEFELSGPLTLHRVEERVTGRVIDESGAPVAGVTVLLLHSPGNLGFRPPGRAAVLPGGMVPLSVNRPRAVTGPAGTFEMVHHLAPDLVGGFWASAEDGRVGYGPLVVDGSHGFDPVDPGTPVEITLHEPIVITGSVALTGLTEVAASLQITTRYKFPGGVNEHTAHTRDPLFVVAPDSRGQFEIGPLPGTATVRIAPVNAALGTEVSTTLPASGPAEPLRFEMYRTSGTVDPTRVNVTVSVLDADTGQPIPHVRIQGIYGSPGSAITGPRGEPVSGFSNTYRRGGPEEEPSFDLTLGAPGYQLVSLEGAKGIVQGDHRTLEPTGWRVAAEPGASLELTVRLRRVEAGPDH